MTLQDLQIGKEHEKTELSFFNSLFLDIYRFAGGILGIMDSDS